MGDGEESERLDGRFPLSLLSPSPDPERGERSTRSSVRDVEDADDADPWLILMSMCMMSVRDETKQSVSRERRWALGTHFQTGTHFPSTSLCLANVLSLPFVKFWPFEHLQ